MNTNINPNQQKRLNRALFAAIKGADIGKVNAALAAGADPRAKYRGKSMVRLAVDMLGTSPLLDDNEIAMCESLLNAGGTNGASDLQLLLDETWRRCDAKLLSTILTNVRVPRALMSRTRSCWLNLVPFNRVELLKLVFDSAAHANECGEVTGEPPLQTAIRIGCAFSNGSSDFVSHLLEIGARVDAEYDGRTALQLACQLPASADVVRALLDGGADPELLDANDTSVESYMQTPGQELACAEITRRRLERSLSGAVAGAIRVRM